MPVYRVRIEEHKIASLFVRANDADSAKNFALSEQRNFLEVNDSTCTALEIPDTGQAVDLEE